MGGEKLNAEFFIFPSSCPVFLQFLVFSVDYHCSTPLPDRLELAACCRAIDGSRGLASGSTVISFCIFIEFSLREAENLPQHGIIRPCVPSAVSIHLAPLREKEWWVTCWKSQCKGLVGAGTQPGMLPIWMGSLSVSQDIPVLAMHWHPHQTCSLWSASPPPAPASFHPGRSGLKPGIVWKWRRLW